MWAKANQNNELQLVIALNEKSIDIYWIYNTLFALLLLLIPLPLLLLLLLLLLQMFVKIANIAINRWFNVCLVPFLSIVVVN